MATKKKSFVVDRAKWRCGKEGRYATGIRDEEGCLAKTKLLDEHGSMCCLGFVSQQCGVPKKALDTYSPANLEPAQARKVCPVLIKPDGWEHPEESGTQLNGEAIKINDNVHLTRRVREKRLKAVFKKHGYSIKFIGRYPKKGKA